MSQSIDQLRGTYHHPVITRNLIWAKPGKAWRSYSASAGSGNQASDAKSRFAAQATRGVLMRGQNMNEIWQEVNCPQGADFDLFDADCVYAGQEFYCQSCDGKHIAAKGVVETFCDTAQGMSYPALPGTAAGLAALIKGTS